MDFTTQNKLTRAEWNSVEEPVSEDEQTILKMIIAGYDNVNIRQNDNISLLNRIKIEKSTIIEKFLYCRFFKSSVAEIQSIPNIPSSIAKFSVKEEAIKKLKKSDIIRLENMESKINEIRESIIEYTFLKFAKEMFTLFLQGKTRYVFYLYTIIQLRNISVENINCHLMEFIDLSIKYISENTKLSNIISNAQEFIEKNPHIYKYADNTLYDHQKRLFSTLKKSYTSRVHNQSNLILYIAPTGTGKTLSPIGISNNYKVIFVCAARHVGIALAKSAISVHKCVAFAFGCETASDIRLHYYSALTYKIDKKSGGIGKVDNSVGNKVEMMICDAKSYLTAMHYMLSFNSAHTMVTYWDEPTIGMDDTNEDNVLHAITHENWSENKIPNMVLSSATLPKTHELQPMIDDFRSKFDNVVVTEINSYDCRKSITILNKMGYCSCPHLLHEDYRKMIECAEYCDSNRTLLRYFDLGEVVRFIDYLTRAGDIKEDYSADIYFDGSIKNIKMNSIKLYYITLLKQIDETRWSFIYNAMRDSLVKWGNTSIKKSVSLDRHDVSGSGGGGNLTRTSSVSHTRVREKTTLEIAREMSATHGNILITTVDAHTLTDGPTIYLAEDVDKIGNFYIQQSHIPKEIFDDITCKIEHNNNLMKNINKLNLELEDVLGEEMQKDKKMSNMELTSPKAKRIDESIQALKSELKIINLESCFIPNTVLHQEIWVSRDPSKHVRNAFVPNIDPETVREIMNLEVTDGMKMLLLLGIGVFSETANSFYVEIIKKLAHNKKLFMIIASSDYIYGTNYQFCHGFLGKDLKNMTQQKTIQALGRIGRNNIQQEYTARFRDDEIIANLFCENANNVEAQNMCRLLRTI